MIATTLYGLLTLGLAIGGKHVSAYEAYEMASDVVDATPEPLLFPGERDHERPMSNNTILFALYRMGYHSRMTGHAPTKPATR